MSCLLVVGCGALGGRLITRWTAGRTVAVDVAPLPESFGTKQIRIDVIDAGSLTSTIHLSSPDVVVYAAGLSTAASERDPGRAEAVHVHGAMAAFRAAIDSSASRFMYLSSFAVYGFGASGRMHEDRPLAPSGRYAELKANAEYRLTELARSQRPGATDLLIARPCGMYGDASPCGSLSQRFLHRTVQETMDGATTLPAPEVNLDEFWHFDDAADTLITMAQSAPASPDRGATLIFNAGPGRRTTGAELEEALRQINPLVNVDYGTTPDGFGETAPLDVATLRETVADPAPTGLGGGLKQMSEAIGRSALAAAGRTLESAQRPSELVR